MYYPADLKWANLGSLLPARSLLTSQISYPNLKLASNWISFGSGRKKNDTCLSRTVQHREL